MLANPTWLLINDTFRESGINIVDEDSIIRVDTSGSFYQLFPDGRATREGCYSIGYIVSDSKGNSAYLIRYVVIVDVKPYLSIKGDSIDCIFEGAKYKSKGYDSFECFSAVVEGCINDGEKPGEGIYKYRYKAGYDLNGNSVFSNWKYVIVKDENDTSGCILYDLLKDTCQKKPNSILYNISPKTNVLLYPNPNNGEIYFKFQELKNKMNLEIYTVNGSLVECESIREGNPTRVKLKSGIYFYRIPETGDTGTILFK